MSRERVLSSEYEDRVMEMIGGSACAGCPIMEKQFVVPALRIDHGINWAATSYAVNLPKIALTAIVNPESVSGMRSQDRRELTEDFTRFFGQTPEDFVESLDITPTTQDIKELAVGLVVQLPDKNKKAGDALVEELQERLSTCPNTRKKRVTCALK